MKNKYKIVDQNPKVSDRELEGFMDFDVLMEENALRNKPQATKPNNFGILGAALAVIAVLTWCFWPSDSAIPATVAIPEIANETIENRDAENIVPIHAAENFAQDFNTNQNNKLEKYTDKTSEKTTANIDIENGVERAPAKNTPIEKFQNNNVEKAARPKNVVTSPTSNSDSEASTMATTTATTKDLISAEVHQENSTATIPKVEHKATDQIAIIDASQEHNPKTAEITQPIDVEHSIPEHPKKEVRTSLAKGAHVFVDAEPLGGTSGLYEYIDEKLRYPDAVEDKTIKGEVLLSFTIDKKGRPRNIKVQASMGEHFDQEAIRVIEAMPDWDPATLNGIPMESNMSLTLYFNPKN